VQAFLATEGRTHLRGVAWEGFSRLRGAEVAVQPVSGQLGDDFGEALFRFEVDGVVKTLCFDGDLDVLIIGTDQGLFVISAKSGVPLCEYSCSIQAMCYFEKDRLLVTSSSSSRDSHDKVPLGLLRVWRLEPSGSLEMLHQDVEENPDGALTIYCMAADIIGRRFFVGRNNGELAPTVLGYGGDGCALSRGKASKVHDSRVLCAEYADGCDIVFTVGNEVDSFGFLRAWRCFAGGQLQEVAISHQERRSNTICVKFDPVQQLLVTGNNLGQIMVWKLDSTGTLALTSLAGERRFSSAIYGLACDPRRRLLYIGTKDDSLRAAILPHSDEHAERPLGVDQIGRRPLGSCTVSCMVYDPSRSLLIMGTEFGKLRAHIFGKWGSGSDVGAMATLGSKIKCMAFDTDSRLLVTADAEVFLRVWRVNLAAAEAGAGRGAQTEAQPGTFEQLHSADGDGLNSIMSLAWSLSSRLLFAGDTSGVVCCWRLGTDGSLDMISQSALSAGFGAILCMRHVAMGDGQVLLTGSKDGVLTVWDCHPATGALTQLYCESEAHKASGRPMVSSIDFDHERSLCFTTGCGGALCVWKVAFRGSGVDRLSKLHEEEVLLHKPTADAALRNPVQCRYMPGKRVLITCGAGSCAPRLWSVNDAGALTELWFPSHVYRGDTTLLVAAPSSDSDPTDAFGLIWMASNQGRVVGISTQRLQSSSVVASLEVDRFLVPALLQWRVPFIAYTLKAFVMVVSFLQLVGFSLVAATPPSLEPPKSFLKPLIDIDLFHATERFEFDFAAGFTAFLGAIFIFQEWMAEWALLNPDLLLPAITFVIMDFLMLVGTGLLVIPLLTELLKCMACVADEKSHRIYLASATTVECWGSHHIFGWLLPGWFCAVSLGYMGARFTRVRWSLTSIKLKWDPRDWSSDAVVPPDRVPRRQPLELNEVYYDGLALIAKFIMMGAQHFVPLTRLDKETQELILATCICLSGLLLLRTSFAFQRFFDPGHLWALPLPCRMEPNAVQTALDIGVCWSYLTQLIAAAVKFRRDQVLDDQTSIVLSSLFVVPMFCGYLVRAWTIRARRWSVRPPRTRRRLTAPDNNSEVVHLQLTGLRAPLRSPLQSCGSGGTAEPPPMEPACSCLEFGQSFDVLSSGSAVSAASVCRVHSHSV